MTSPTPTPKPRTKQVVPGFDIFFKDDFTIIDSEIARRLELPKPYITDRDELWIMKKERLYELGGKVASPPADAGQDYMKVYTETYLVKPIGNLQDMNEKYFSDNAAQIKELKKKFIESCLDMSQDLPKQFPGLYGQIGKELCSKIDSLGHDKHGSDIAGVFEQAGTEGILVVDKKVYDLVNTSNFILKYEKSFDPTGFSEICSKVSAPNPIPTPREVASILVSYKDHISPRAFPLIKDKIWCNDKSSELRIGGIYLIPEYRGRLDMLEDGYKSLLDLRIKREAAEEFGRGPV